MVFFIVRPTTAALLHRNPASAGKFSDSCRARGSDKRNGTCNFSWEGVKFNYHSLHIIIYYHYLLTLLCMVFTICVACTATSHDKCLYIYISSLGTAQYCMAVFCSSLMQWIPPTLLRYFLSDFDNGSNCPSCYWYHFCIEIPHKLHIIIILISELF